MENKPSQAIWVLFTHPPTGTQCRFGQLGQSNTAKTTLGGCSVQVLSYQIDSHVQNSQELSHRSTSPAEEKTLTHGSAETKGKVSPMAQFMIRGMRRYGGIVFFDESAAEHILEATGPAR